MMVMSTYQTTLWRYSSGIQPGKSGAGPRTSTGPTSATGISADFGARGKQSRTTGHQQQTPETSLKVVHWNAEGIRNKKPELQEFLRSNKVDVLCAQETHLSDNHRFFVRGYELFRNDRTSGHKGGVLTLVRNNIPSVESSKSGNDSIEFISVKLILPSGELTISNCYSAPTIKPQLELIPINSSPHLVVGDFNGHSPSWGYKDLNTRGEEIEDWMLENRLILINLPDDPPTCYSRAWKTKSTPDLAMGTGDMHKLTTRTVNKQLGGSDHLPITLTITSIGSSEVIRKEPSWNFKKANWSAYREKAEKLCRDLEFSDNLHKNVELITKAILDSATGTIPRGSRKNYQSFWSPELEQMHSNLTSAREDMEQSPIPENIRTHNLLNEEFHAFKTKEIQKSWHEKTSSLNMERDTTKLWKLTRSLDEDTSCARAQTVIEDSGTLHTGKMAANVLADAFQEVSKLEIPKTRTKEVESATRDQLQAHAPKDCMTKDFSSQELNSAIKKLKTKKAPGKDGIAYEMIIRLGPHARKKLTELLNQSWQSGKFPNQWKEAIIIPILKKGKPKKEKGSYRPISLLSCLGKLMERLVNGRLLNYLEANQLLNNYQTGYRKNRSTEDQLILLAQEIENAFQEKKKVIAVFVDLSKAFDKVWKKGLLLKLATCGINGNMFYWIKNLLNQRTARVKVDGKTSHIVKLCEGVPQGGIISTTLFLVFINDIMNKVPPRISRALHADDLAAWHAAETLRAATIRMQDTLDHISKWANDWGVQINTRKTVSTCFSLAKKPETYTLHLNGQELPHEDTPTYLGATLDRTLTWNVQIQKTAENATRRLSLMKKLAGTSWGANSRILKTVYVGSVRPVMEYGMTAWATAAKTNTKKLDQVQNTGLRIITGAMKTTPINEMEKITGLHSLTERKEEKVLIHSEKLKRLQSHPACNKISEPTKNRIKRTSFNHLSKDLGRQHTEIIGSLQSDREPLHDTESLEIPLPDIKINTDIPGIRNKRDLPSLQLKSITLEVLDRDYNTSEWTHVYTDGSAEAAVRNGGSGILIRFPDGQRISKSLPTGRLCTNYKAEQTALLAAAKLLETANPRSKIVFLSDCKSVLDNLRSPARNQSTSELHAALLHLSIRHTIVLQWIPSHCQIEGNEEADKLSKEGSKSEQPPTSISYSEAKGLIKNTFHQAWKDKLNIPTEDISLQRLERWQQTIIFRLRTGHCQLLSHMYRLKLSHTNECPCGTGVQDAEHILQDCPTHATERASLWPTGASLLDKLWGSKQQLVTTAIFVRNTKLKI